MNELQTFNYQPQGCPFSCQVRTIQKDGEPWFVLKDVCQVLGMSKTQAFFHVVLLQVIKRIIAPISNEIMTLVKDTSLARIIAVYEIIWSGEAFIKSDGLLWPLFYTGAFYLICCGLLTILFNKLEKKLSYFSV